MVQHIHICPVGFYSEPILAAVGGPMPADKYYCLYNENEKCMEAMEKVINTLIKIGQKDMYREKIDPFDYSSVIGKIMEIHHCEMKLDPESRFYINFTSGTNIVAGACCSASYFIGATLYYVMNTDAFPDKRKSELIKIIQTPKIPDIEKMKPFAKDILKKICASNGIELKNLADFMQSSPQKINHHLNSFLESGLISKSKNGRNVVLNGTQQGKMLCTWMSEDE